MNIYYEGQKDLQEIMIKKFVYYIPGYLKLAIKLEEPAEVEKIANAMDYFEFHYRNYLAGVHQTMHRVMEETRYFQSVNGFTPLLMQNLLKNIEKDILENELYELMNRALTAKGKILKELSRLK